KSGKMLVIWKERAIPSRQRAAAPRAAISTPAKRIAPASDRSSPDSWLISVVFPAPLGPMMAWVSPASTLRSTAWVATSPPNDLTRPGTARSGSAILGRGAGDQTEEAAPGEQHDDDEDRAHYDLPVGRPRRERVLQEEKGRRSHHGPDQRPHAPEDHHEH